MALHKPEHRTWEYWLLWPFLVAIFCIAFPIALIFRGYARTRYGWIRDLENYIDDPFDWLKEWIHCRKLPLLPLQVNISFLMQNRHTTWNIIRKHGKNWHNCDEEDK